MDLGILLRAALRPFRRQPLYAFTCVGTLALAMAAAITSFAVVERAFLDPLPYPDGERLVAIYTHTETWDTAPVSTHVVADLAAHGAPLSDFTVMEPEPASFTNGGSTERLIAVLVEPAFFRTLGAPNQGRGWEEGERDVVVLSWAFWQNALGGDPSALGSSLTLDGRPHTVVGIMPRGFAPPYWPGADILRPLHLGELRATRPRWALDVTVLARRNDDASWEQVERHMEAFSTRLQREYPEAHARERWIARPLRDELVGSARPVLLGTGAAALLLLLIVGANIAGLSAALAVGDRQRLGVQRALGATRWRLLLERALHGAALGLLGSAVGIWLAHSLIGLVASFQPQFMSRMSAIGLGVDLAAWSLVAGMVIAMVASTLPHAAVIAGRLDALPSARGATASPGLMAARSALVVVQVALALVLLVGAGLLVRTMQTLADTSLGFRSEGLVALQVALPSESYAEREARVRFEERLLERLRAIPGVEEATASGGIPVIGGGRVPLLIQGREARREGGEVAFFSTAPGFLGTWRIPVVAGRDFGPGDRIDAPGAILINETAARRFWPDGDALGARVWLGANGPGEGETWMTVVGVVKDLRQHGPAEQVLPTAFASTHQVPWPGQWYTVRTSGSVALVREEDLRAAVSAVDPAVPIGRIRNVNDLVVDATASQRLVLIGLGGFAIVAVALCGFGIYAVVSLTSRLRSREYAIRLAVGAQPVRVRWLVLRQGLVLGLAGVGIGLLLAGAGTRALDGLLHGVSSLDGLTFSAAAAGVLAITLLGAWRPARQVERLDPVTVLSAE